MTAREVELTGGAPWGFRMHGGTDHGQPLRISRQSLSDSPHYTPAIVNPGRKASLIGIREGDVISSINGRSTRSMSNADAHTMLRSAGPVLRLGLNEDRDVSPRRRSIGKGCELKRPSQLTAEVQSRAILQAPVYATIRPSQPPNHRLPSSPMRASLNSLPAALNSTPLVKSVVSTEEPLTFHPTNPFYTTLPSNYSSASKLPVPNSRASLSSLDKSKSIDKSKDASHFNNYNEDLKSPSFFTKAYNSELKDIPINGYSSSTEDRVIKNGVDKETKRNNWNNPFKRNEENDPYDKYLHPASNINGKCDFGDKAISNSVSENNCHINKEITERSTLTEQQIREVEEVKIIKKTILNGSSDAKDCRNEKDTELSPSKNKDGSNFSSYDANHAEPRNEKYFTLTPKHEASYEYRPSAPTLYRNDYFFDDSISSREERNLSTATTFYSDRDNSESSTAKTSSVDVVTTKPPVKSPAPSTPVTTPNQTTPVWRPGAPTPPPAPALSSPRSPAGVPPPPPPPPVWMPGSAGASPQTPRKSFRPVHFEETPPARRKFESDQNGFTSGSESESRLKTSHSAPAAGLSTLGAGASRLPRAQNPTVTLLQKAREGQIPRGTNYVQDSRLPRDRASPPKSDPVHALRREYASEGEAERGDYERVSLRKMADTQRRVEGIGPTTKDGMPVALRSEVKDPSKWYKQMYDTIHKNKYDDDYVTIRYKSRRGQPPQRITNKSQYAYFDPRSGYLSEPEGGLSRVSSACDAYDSDVTTGPRRRTASAQDERRYDDIASPYMPSNKYSTLASARASQEIYRSQPGRIENYVPGRSSVVDKEAKQWWDEVMDIFDGWLDDNSPLPPYSTLLARAIQKSQNVSSTTSLPQALPKDKRDLTATILSKSNMARALKESGYESDSTLVFRRRDETDGPLSPAERRAAYKELQAGGEPPLRGFRSPAPPRQDETEIEYIPISPTLTKIRVHKKTPNIHEVICYPVTKIHHEIDDKEIPYTADIEYPPAPPRRMSSKNSRTLKLVSSNVSTTSKKFPIIDNQSQSNVNFLKEKISNKLSRQNTHIVSRKSLTSNASHSQTRSQISRSAPPDVSRRNIMGSKTVVQKPSSDIKNVSTSSFSSPRRTLLPTEYSKSLNTKFSQPCSSVIIEGGAGRKTPITNILDKVTTLDKLWSSEKRNERIDVTKAKSKSITKISSGINNKGVVSKTAFTSTHRSRDMTRTAERIQRHKLSNIKAKSNPYLNVKNEAKLCKPSNLQISSNISKSVSNVSTSTKKPSYVKTAIITNLKKKKLPESVTVRPRSVPCHETSNKKAKDVTKTTKKCIYKTKSAKKSTKSSDSESCSQFGDTCQNDNLGHYNNVNSKLNNSKEIKETHDAVISNSFFQHLFFGNHAPTLSCYPMLEHNTMVLEKAKMFQSQPPPVSSAKSLNSYLLHRKPVSLSRFKMWDRCPSPINIYGPRSISWPGRKRSEIQKFDSLSKRDEFGSNSSVATVRSKSEPPTSKIYFSQTSRPKSPTVIFNKSGKSNHDIDSSQNVQRFTSPPKNFFTQTSRPISPRINNDNRSKEKVLSPKTMLFTDSVRSISPLTRTEYVYLKTGYTMKEDDSKYPSTIFFSQKARPVSPKIEKKSRSQSSSPVCTISPSYRRIYNVRLQNVKQTTESKKSVRTKSAERDDIIPNSKLQREKTKSDTYLYESDPDYSEYIQDLHNSKKRSDRFRELNRYYAYLERVNELEKTTSTSDLRHRKKDEEIVDFDRWKKIRAIEKAEEELHNLYKKLKLAQNESDFLFYTRDVNDFRWNYDKDRGLRIKEKSVEDLKEHFQQFYSEKNESEHGATKDTYKPFWRGTSVAETAFNINRRNKSAYYVSPVRSSISWQEQEPSFIDLRKKIGLGNRLWSSLSMEQVTALKNQLNAIYSKELEKTNQENEKFVVDIPDKIVVGDKKPLHVRSNSLITSSSIQEKELSKSGSIAAISSSVTTIKDLKNNVNKIQMSLTENEKRKISQTLSNEVLKKVTRSNDASLIIQQQPLPLSEEINEITKLKQIIEIKPGVEINEIANKRHIVYPLPVESIEPQYHSSASETETGSSDHSNKTVIYKGPIDVVKKKVKYFESVNEVANSASNIANFHSRESCCESDNKQVSSIENCVSNAKNHNIIQSQSCTNIKELFGESDKNKFLSLPSKPEKFSRSPSPSFEVNITESRTPDTLQYSSNESIWRSRSTSPDPERYWRTYLNLARAGEVRRLTRRFESPPSRLGTVLRRHRSDPEIVRNVINKNWSSIDDIISKHDKQHFFPVVRIPLRSSNRLMPHIDIISKLASLKKRMSPRSRSADDTLECRTGEVNRIRRRFEAMSLLGQVYASAPDVSELRDIAPYLAGPWVSHRYPKPTDNNRSVQNPNSFVQGRASPVTRDDNKKRHILKKPLKLCSILKNEEQVKKEFDPTVHQPICRYEPPRAPPRPPPASWPYRLAPLITSTRHTVTFKESESAPEPPRRLTSGSYSETESPRRYVESDVNIHYRCPVRHDPLPLVPERELARQQAEHMKRLYREQKRNKYLQENAIHPNDIDAFDAHIKELQDMQNRRHQDNFTPAQKTIVPLNRYDEADKVVAKALYTFNGQTSRELSFKKGEIINVRRQIDSNWYEGELHGRIGLFPYNYVEILKGETTQSVKKPGVVEGRARAKFDFIAQTKLELPLKKGEVVTLTRRIDHNWWEGRTANKTGIFPDSYVTVLQEPSQNKPKAALSVPASKGAGSPAARGLLNGAAAASLAAHSYTPQHNSPALSNSPQPNQPLPGYVAKPASATLPSARGYGPPAGRGVDLNNSEPLYVDTNAEAVPYRAMYKYRPQNPDELELSEGDTVYVLEKCDDGWYVGSSQRTGRFGTFPGNYVERI